MIREITDKDIPELQKLCVEEEHGIVCPTHVIERDGRVTGAMSIDAVAPIFMFLSKKYENKLDMLSIRRFVKSYCDSFSINDVLVNIPPQSPGWSIMEKMGNSYVGTAHLWHKRF